LNEQGAYIKAFDPVAEESARRLLTDTDTEFCEDEYAVAKGSDALVIVTEWNQFRSLDLKRIRETMRSANIIDLRNIYEPDTVRSLGFSYVSIGRA
jgi:UDPglucose 6-dehydrogenase